MQRLPKIALAMCLFLSGAWANTFAQGSSVLPLTADQVVQKMVERNAERAQALEGYRGTRVYQLEYHGFSKKSAEMIVTMTYQRPDEKGFCVLSESGSEFLHKRILRKLLEAEVEAMHEGQRRQTAMGPENYEFSLAADEKTLEPGSYVLEVTPRIKNKFMFKGRIWVDAQDFAVTRMEGEPAKNPSWWTKRNAIYVTYEKVGEFWLLSRNETSTQVRMLGRSRLTIVYQDYEILNTATVLIASSSAKVSCPAQPEKLSAARLNASPQKRSTESSDFTPPRNLSNK